MELHQPLTRLHTATPRQVCHLTKFSISLTFAALLLTPWALHAQAQADPDFDASVRHKTYEQTHPKVVIDEAHNNFHTASNRYKPLADLLINDGYDVVPGTGKFAAASLRSLQVLIIANARGSEVTEDHSGPAFTGSECDAVRDWVKSGGALLLIADHTPFGEASADLATRFGVQMGMGIVFDLNNYEIEPTILVFSIENGLLGRHPILLGRNESERIRRVVAFAGQSLDVPPGAFPLLSLSATARESRTQADLRVALEAADKHQDDTGKLTANTRSSAGRVQGLALTFGKGRVVILGEAGLFSAQILKSGGPQNDFKFGMNTPGNDDKQFALNVLHWLSGAL